MTIKVLIIDDSALMRALLKKIIDSAPDLEVVGEAPDPIVAREMIKALNPDVLTLDVEMPRMDGLEFLRRLMKLRPMPVVMISTLTERGSEVTMQALELGAVDFLPKPRMETPELIEAYSEDICEKIRAAAGAMLTAGASARVTAPAGGVTPRSKTSALRPFGTHTLNDKLIAIGASTGGTEAIKDVLIALPEQTPGIVISQHMPELFTVSFAKRLDRLARITVIEAQGGERILPGHAYLAPGNAHLLVKKAGGSHFTELSQGPPVNRHRPSVDVMFRSVAEVYGHNAVGVLLTGMGKDGAQGLLEMRQTGAWTIGQNQATCVVYGMPREAALLGAVDEAVPLQEVADHILTHLHAAEQKA